MDYKALYWIVFAPILITLLYMLYAYYSNDQETDVKNLNTKNIQQMSLEKNTNFEQIGLESFQKELASWETILIDVRKTEEQEEYGVVSDDQLHIIYWEENFEEEILKLDTNKKYLVYCRRWARSTAVREFMQANEFSWVKDLEGGIETWNS